MVNGLILLAFIAVMLALVIARVRRRIGMPVTGGIMALTVAGIAIVILIMWATSTR